MKMCESAAYLLEGAKEKLILEGVDLLEDRGDRIRIVNIFGEEKEIEAQIRVLSLVDHKIVLESK